MTARQLVSRTRTDGRTVAWGRAPRQPAGLSQLAGPARSRRPAYSFGKLAPHAESAAAAHHPLVPAVRLLPGPRTIVEGQGDNLEKAPVDPEPEANATSGDTTAVADTGAADRIARPEEPNEPALLVDVWPPAMQRFDVDSTRTPPSSSRPTAWPTLLTLPKGRGVFISGPPVAKPLGVISAGGGAGAAGYTDWPTGYKAPDFDFNSAKTGSDWFSKPTLKTAAFEGTSGSFYTDAGKHKTANQEAGKDVYWNFSPAISSLVKVGEQEHCDDYAEAYKISLKEADTIIRSKLDGQTFGPKASKAEAEGLVLGEITANLTHAGLGNDKTKWAGIYNTLFTKTRTRDTSGWHTIKLGARSVDGAGNVVYEVVAGTSQIGTKASNAVIKY